MREEEEKRWGNEESEEEGMGEKKREGAGWNMGKKREESL